MSRQRNNFPGEEKLFHSNKSMVLMCNDEHLEPCVIWYEHDFKKHLTGSFVATLAKTKLEEECDVIIMHSFIHPSDCHSASKVKGRTIAALRMIKYMDQAYKSPLHLAYILSACGPNSIKVRFFVKDAHTANRLYMGSEDGYFLGSVFTRLIKIHEV